MAVSDVFGVGLVVLKKATALGFSIVYIFELLQLKWVYCSSSTATGISAPTNQADCPYLVLRQ